MRNEKWSKTEENVSNLIDKIKCKLLVVSFVTLMSIVAVRIASTS